MKKALITGITGQDGSYLAEWLLGIGYEVHGVIRRSSSLNTGRIDHLYEEFGPDGSGYLRLHFGDLSDPSALTQLLHRIQPSEIYNLGAQSHVRVSFDLPEYTGDVSGLGTIRLLEAYRSACPEARFYQASSSEMFGASPPPQSEETNFYPRSPYGVAKVYSYWITRNYREAYGLHCSNGILFNHESPRRGATFVTRKITRAAARIKQGLQSELVLGNLDAERDWGYAPEFVVGMWKMLQQDAGDDYVLATGRVMSVRDFLEATFQSIGLQWERYVRIDERYFRPTEVDVLIGDAGKASQKFGWEPEVMVNELAEIMVKHDLDAINSQDPHHVDLPRWPSS